MGDFDPSTFDAVIREQLHAAAREGADGEEIAEILLRHRDGIEQRGLAEHAGFEVFGDGRDDC